MKTINQRIAESKGICWADAMKLFFEMPITWRYDIVEINDNLQSKERFKKAICKAYLAWKGTNEHKSINRKSPQRNI